MTKLLQKRVRITFEFDAYINDAKIHSSTSDEVVKQMDLALLHHLIAFHPDQLNTLLVERALSNLDCYTLTDKAKEVIGYPCEDDEFYRHCLTPAIDGLSGPHREAWQEIKGYETAGFNECSEGVTDCIEVKMVSAAAVVVE